MHKQALVQVRVLSDPFFVYQPSMFQVTGFLALLEIWSEKKGVGTACTGGVQAVQPGSVTSGGCFEVLWNLELNQNRNICTFQRSNFGTIWTVQQTK